MSSPWPGIALLGFYLYFIYRLGPSLMANRRPFHLDRIMQIYDVIQIILSTYLFYKALVLGWLSDYSFACQPVDYSYSPRAIEIAQTVHLYFVVKIIDLLDTVFFVLRKKDQQVSFLHVYHHTGMVLASWGGVKYLAGGHSTFLGLINSFVHMIMYTHYLVMSLKIAKPWWKKYITQMQLIQFFLILYHFSQLLWREYCGFPRWTAAIFIPQNLFMIVLFGEFYYKAYIKKPKTKTEVTKNGHVKTESLHEKQKTT
ncbi:elongation of very long chain fatty acids protein 7-like isoform X2 [Phymastichus coffea]|nr:elongation of very long chain fatty acids protein 7-like isoform X2 [Phymastichus coffea]